MRGGRPHPFVETMAKIDAPTRTTTTKTMTFQTIMVTLTPPEGY